MGWQDQETQSFFWKDLWNGQILEHKYLELFSFAINGDITLYTGKTQDSLRDLFNTPLSKEAYSRYCELDIIVQSFT
jgi:hypothetical protein